ncbi:MAG: sulfite exporter TauE/SafE family protein [Actinobacteria bacterium]|nr:sulfite exporter TauE/SafE family protein [Actinomycetota bacterium]
MNTLQWRHAGFWHDQAVEILAGLLAGAFIGSVLGLVGAGGAMLSVPILLFISGFTPLHASTAALAVVFAAAAFGSIPKFRKHDVLIREALTIWGLGLITNVGGSWLSHRVSGTFITTGFAVVLFFAATSMLVRPPGGTEKRIPFLILVGVSLLIGSITGLFGIGGGFLAIPILVLFFHTPQNKAAGTSLVIISMNSLTALLAHQPIWHEINWSVPGSMTVSAIIVATLASHTSAKFSAVGLRRAFAFLLYAVAIFTLLETYFF